MTQLFVRQVYTYPLPYRYMVNEYYLEHPEEAKRDLQVLCANCNWLKRDLKRECLSLESKKLSSLISKIK